MCATHLDQTKTRARRRATASKIRICSSLIPDASRDALCHRPLPSRAQCRARAVLDGSTARASFLSSAKMRVYVIRHAQSANNALRASSASLSD